MKNRDALIALRDAVKADGDISWGYASGPARAVFGDMWHKALDAYCGSLDAAKALHEAVLPGWPWTIDNMNSGLSRAWTNKTRGLRTPGYKGEHGDPARAWLLAILEALIAEAGE